MEIEKSVENQWTEQFSGSYPNTDTRFAVISDTTDFGNPEKTSMVLARTTIPLGDFTRQKYIAAIRFFNFGDMATIDIVSISGMDMHRQMTTHHAQKLEWLIPKNTDVQKAPFSSLDSVPFLYSGGFIEKTDGLINLNGQSSDYGAYFIGDNINDISAFVLQSCNHTVKNDCVVGESNIQKMLKLMLEKKKSPFFYEELVKEYTDKDTRITSPMIKSLLNMKVVDRHIQEETDYTTLLVEEMSKFSGSVLLNGLTNIRR